MTRKVHVRRVRTILMLIFALCMSAPVAADQRDPRLDVLFEQLFDAQHRGAAKLAEREIWSIWHEPPDAKSDEIMRDARQALDANDYASAIDYLNQLVEHAPDYSEAWNQRAIVLFLADDFAGALRDIEQTLRLEPRHFGALSGRGQIYMHLDEPHLAIKAFESALERNPWMENIRRQMQMLRGLIDAKPQAI